MTTFEIDGVPVKFPFEPYPVQKNYMQKVIESLTKAEHAILESPTGTGKTLSLLCATLAWIETQKQKQQEREEELMFVRGTEDEKSATGPASIRALLRNINESSSNINEKTSNESIEIPQVIYASRTHSQILQAMKELKRSAYNHMKAGVIASRDQLCMRTDLRDKPNTDKIDICSSLVKKKKCEYYKNVENGLKAPELQENNILDIEELSRIGKKLQCCPFYVSKELRKRADIVFMPYNYLLDPNIRKATQLNLKNAIVIFDEAHNVEKVCEQSASTKITSEQIDTAIGNAIYAINTLKKESLADMKFTIDNVKNLKSSLENLKREIDSIQINAPDKDGYISNGGYIFSLLEKAGINENTHESLVDLLNDVIACMIELSSKKRKYVTGLRAVLGFLRIVFSSSAPNLRDQVNKCYKVYIEPDNKTDNKPSTSKPENSKTINFWCFSPKFGMQFLLNQNIRCLILTSGTLAPLDALINEMEMSIPIQLKNPHIIKDFQVFAKIIGNGPDRQTLDSCFKNRDSNDYLKSLGNTILEFSKVVPDGLLVFFPSYVLMNSCIAYWNRNGIWSQIDQQKKIFQEPKTKKEFQSAMRNYYATINDPNSGGAIFMAVLRGKVSEGLDFENMYGRAVIVTGIPFAPCKDPKVILKKRYLNDNRTLQNKMLSADEWYVLDSVRAINQAIGRVIRHKFDYGGILLCDNRFNWNKRDISEWIQPHLQVQNTDEPFSSVLGRMTQFFTHAKGALPKPELKLAIEYDIVDGELFEDELTANMISDSSDSESSDDESDGDQPFASHLNNLGESITSRESQVRAHQRKRKKLSIESDKEDPFIKFMENDLGTTKYQKLCQIFFKYNIDADYQSFRDSLFEIFNDKQWQYRLKGMILFMKPVHKSTFEKDVELFLSNVL